MKKLIASVLVLALAIVAAPINLVAAGRAIAQNTAAINGTAVVEGKPMANTTVRLRNVDNGQLVGNMTTNAQGEFSFNGLPAGNYVVETVSANGTVLGTSAKIVLAAGATVAAVTVTTSAAAAAAGVGGGVAAGVAGGGAFIGTTAGIVTAVAIGAGVTAAVVAATNDASASGG